MRTHALHARVRPGTSHPRLCARASPPAWVRMPAHLLLPRVRLGAHPDLSEQRERAQIPSHTGVHTPHVNIHISHLLAHTPSGLHAPPQSPYLTPVCTHPGTQSGTHPLHPHSSCTPRGCTKMHTHFLTPLCTHLHLYSFGGALGAPTHAVHPRTLPAAWGSRVAPQHRYMWHTHPSLAGVHRKPCTRPWRRQQNGAAPRVPAALPPHRCRCQRRRLQLGANRLRTRCRRRRWQSFGSAVAPRAQPWPAACAPNERCIDKLTRPHAAPRRLIN